MRQKTLGALLGLLACAGGLSAFEVGATLKKVDADKGVIDVFANGQDRTVRVAKDAKIQDEKGKLLSGGLESASLKAGTEVTLTVEPGADNRPEIKAIRLGRPAKAAAGRGQPPPKVDTSNFKPLPELGTGEYHGYRGGLYPDGKNERPAEHEAAGRKLAAQIQPLDGEGRPSADGKIVLLGVGMSNTSQAFNAFQKLANNDADKNPHLVLVNGAQGGMTAQRTQSVDTPSGRKYWAEVDRRLREAGVTRAQVQAAWVKQADAGPDEGFPKYAQTLREELANIVRIVHDRFPNLKLVYLSGRTYGGYAKTRLNPEPYAYESGFSVKWLIEQQLKGEPGLNYDPSKGAVKAPWLSWGPYLWANGSTPRADGFAYAEGDFTPADGTHESPSGQKKVAGLLLQFFKNDSTTKGWFLKKE